MLPARFPNLLVNGAGGIAVGMATNIPPHNLGETIDACIALIDNPAIGIDDLIAIMPGPDFPTGGIILGRQGIRAAYHLGRGSIVMRGKVEIETIRKDREAIVITEIPYQVNKASMVERIGELVREKKIEGIADLRDESDRDGYRVVIELKRDAMADVVLNQLYRFTPLQSSFGVNMVALDGGRPQVMTLKDLLTIFVAFREQVVSRRTKYPARQGARPRAHLGRPRDRGRQYRRGDPRHPHLARPEHGARDPDGARLAGAGRRRDDDADRRSAPPHCARTAPRGCRWSRRRAILDLRLQRLTALGRDEIAEELDKLADRDRRLSRHPALAGARPGDRQGRTAGGEGGVRHAAPHRDRRTGRRGRGRGPDPARGHGGDRVARRLRQARAAVDLSGAEARRQGPRRHADARGGFRQPPVRRLHAHAGAVLLLARPGLQGKGLAAADGGAAGARQGADQHPAARAGRAHHHHHAAARGRGDLGRARRDVRDHRRHRPPQQAVGLRRRAPLRHHRHEARGGRGDRRRADLHRDATTCC